ncbi:MAG: O-antigen ligase family protein [Bacteroidetes bacterium]|nr:O-antigen ligase family protein [Bacteroidota bacterium]
MLPKKLRFLHPYLHFTGLLLMVAGLPFAKILMSLSQFFIGGNWILEGNFREKWQRLKSNPKAWMLMGIFLMLLPGLLYSEDLPNAMKQLRINLPLFIFPFVLGSTQPLKKSWYHLLIRLFILSVTLATIACSVWGLSRWLNAEFSDIRKISIFISHIRFALLISLAILLGFWILLYKPYRFFKGERFLLLAAMIWMFAFLFILQSISGIVIITVVSTVWIISLVLKKWSRRGIIAFTASLALLIAFVGFSAYKAYHDFFTPAEIYKHKLPEKTALGNPYTHDLTVIENGHYVYSFLNRRELVMARRKRSDYSIDSLDGKGNLTYATLVRFLNSKGLTKDDSGVNALTEKEIHYITKGIANVNYTGLWGVRMRFYQLLWELGYLKRGSTEGTGHTVVMKLEFLRNAVMIIGEHPILGVGIGDVKNTFIEHYERINSWLAPKWRMTCHNQYLYIGVAAGIPGMLLFLFLFFAPLRGERYIPLLVFAAIAAISMLPEDTLTTQEGVSFVAFFYSFFLFSRGRGDSSGSS